jgi:hypothetical protein
MRIQWMIHHSSARAAAGRLDRSSFSALSESETHIPRESFHFESANRSALSPNLSPFRICHVTDGSIRVDHSSPLFILKQIASNVGLLLFAALGGADSECEVVEKTGSTRDCSVRLKYRWSFLEQPVPKLFQIALI